MLNFKENPSLLGNLQSHLMGKGEVAARTAAESLREKLAMGTRSGRKYQKHPRRSSAPGEYPQEQAGKLMRSVNYLMVDQLTHRVGFFGDDMEKLVYLEFRGDPQTGRGRRQPLYMHFVGRDSTATLDEMAQALEGSR